ncbi:TPA: DUF1831 domain-containing protein [Streptococcus suis]|nr:DUF1831 domain-containing protein [Streptococcus suis]NQJ68127.1 DUF1831 domain-containing protein [Streptococcus suis]NQJ76304.1 DUF1831 domain-containing protein [Streptococcus suis]NQO85387.1 DUF1831 domain-containing protein [Streptococcus suis]HEM5491187.1 DUF1831 domain-containing protein [Streptococcus suis]
MAFQQSVTLKDCNFTYHISPAIKKYTLRDNTFEQTKAGHYQLTRLLEEIPNSNQGFLLKIIVNQDLNGFKINITDKSGLHLVNIFKANGNKVIQEKFYFLMDSLIDRDIFTKEGHA